jgi:ABC-type branched-subunit amino acid transport system ATPase component
MKFVMRLCDPVIVLDCGRPFACAAPEKVQNDPRVLDAYLGGQVLPGGRRFRR